jgi:hypothetical protein
MLGERTVNGEAEGRQEYIALLFVPGSEPFDRKPFD